MYLNKVQLYGYVTNDPVLKAIGSTGNKVCTFAVATNSQYKDRNGTTIKETEYHGVVAFGKLAETLTQWFKKGKPIYIEGKLKTDRFVNKDNVEVSKTKIVVENFQFGVETNYEGNKDVNKFKTKEIFEPKEQREVEPSGLDALDYGEVNPDDIPF